MPMTFHWAGFLSLDGGGGFAKLLAVFLEASAANLEAVADDQAAKDADIGALSPGHRGDCDLFTGGTAAVAALIG